MVKEAKVPMPKSRFLKVKCPKCKNEQVVFGCATTTVECKECGEKLSVPTGGKSNVIAKVLQVLS
ncbi:MAG: 30S ribosomal protein S27e [Candidatus Diapherotrites archaeon]|nr:30S ribosomal protein S27e [Candidatus Diapherotrites archaeon]